ncbi:integrin-binding adhesin P66 family protein [Borrelia anserina]|uniref:p66 protein n=3 Tax=Borrelia anserina TaxID=143 RepID=W5SU56_BORAN|nr:integrin-binding adhesin P66 family protein [Borrelia anserina]AHH08576.1 P66 protein precursor [Borrelia anserina BA2]APR65043.1 P66 integral membrane protein [Borrelia anserina Es]UPA06967.1 integrin-binding adhesin P66 family protein [Borrelia anserina]
MKKIILYVFIMLVSTGTILAEETDQDNNSTKLNPWLPKLTFKNSNEFRFDMDELIPGLENKSQIKIKFEPSEKNKEIGKDDPFSAYIKVENLSLKAEGNKDAILKLNVGNITTRINIYDFYIKMESMTNFDFNQESLFGFAPLTSIKSEYYGFSSNDSAIRRTILARSTENKVSTIQFGYTLPQLELVLAIGATGTGNRNHKKNVNKKDQDQKEQPLYNDTYQGILYGTKAQWKPIKNELEQHSLKVIAETPLELNFGLSGAIGNSTFNQSSIICAPQDKPIDDSKLFSPTLSNAAIMASIGLVYKLGLTKINNKNTYLLLQTGSDLGIDPFASDFSIFGYLSKKANTNEQNQFNPKENKLSLNKWRTTNFAFSIGAGIGLAWNIDDGEKESWAIKGKDSYSTRIFGEQDKKSGIGIGITYGQNLYKPTSSRTAIQEIAAKTFKTLNAEISTYEDNKKGIIPNLGWTASIGVYDLLKGQPQADTTDILKLIDTKTTISFTDAAKIGGALYIDYAIPIESISPNTYITPYAGAHLLGSLTSSDKKVYLKAGLELDKLIKLTTISLGWDSNNLLAYQDQKGSVFLQIQISFDE